MPEIRIDTITIAMLVIVMQGAVLGCYAIFRGERDPIPQRIFGVLLLVLTAIATDVLLSYSGYVTRHLVLVDFSEPLNFLVGPLVYLFVKTKLADERKFEFLQLLHILPFLFFVVYLVPYLSQSGGYKFDSYVSIYRPSMEPIGIAPNPLVDPVGVRPMLMLITAIHVGYYAILSAVTVLRASRRERDAISNRALKRSRLLVVFLFAAVALLVLAWQRLTPAFVELACAGLIGLVVLSATVVFVSDTVTMGRIRTGRIVYPSRRVARPTGITGFHGVMEADGSRAAHAHVRPNGPVEPLTAEPKRRDRIEA